MDFKVRPSWQLKRSAIGILGAFVLVVISGCAWPAAAQVLGIELVSFTQSTNVITAGESITVSFEFRDTQPYDPDDFNWISQYYWWISWGDPSPDTTGHWITGTASHTYTNKPSIGDLYNIRVECFHLPTGMGGTGSSVQIIDPTGSFAELLQRDGIDGVEGDPRVGLQEEDETGGGLFQADGQAGLWILLAQLEQPIVQGLR
jgi:hypothetical protein